MVIIKRKSFSGFNLKFDIESKEKFNIRLVKAKKSPYLFETRISLDNLVHQISLEDPPPLPNKSIDEIWLKLNCFHSLTETLKILF
jgi:hypothetical protein